MLKELRTLHKNVRAQFAILDGTGDRMVYRGASVEINANAPIAAFCGKAAEQHSLLDIAEFLGLSTEEVKFYLQVFENLSDLGAFIRKMRLIENSIKIELLHSKMVERGYEWSY